MTFNIYGRFQVDVRREGDRWVVYRLDNGRRALMHDVVVPATMEEGEIATYLDDIFHELSGPGQRVELLS
ncbi:MAG TPA: hypothetical protein VFS95_10430 [Telluria sp.]|jgi:hypothetical protein|nr:hypothetical protein [Telluria sp.]